VRQISRKSGVADPWEVPRGKSEPLRITSEAALRPGDIVYFGNGRDDITHAAIYAGVVHGQRMIWDANTAFWIYPDGVHQRTLASENSLGFVGAARVIAAVR
jgi:cell wall-associated NlpC family hydrolase